MGVKLAAAKAREHFSDLVTTVAFSKQRQVITRNSKDLVALIPIEDLRLLEKLEEEMDLTEAREALAKVQSEGSVPWESIKDDLKEQYEKNVSSRGRKKRPERTARITVRRRTQSS